MNQPETEAAMARSDESDFADLPRGGPPMNRRKKIFVPEVKLGDILVLLGALGGGMLMFTNLDKNQSLDRARIVVLEERQREQDQRNKEALIELKADVKTVQRTLDDLKLNMRATK